MWVCLRGSESERAHISGTSALVCVQMQACVHERLIELFINVLG